VSWQVPENQFTVEEKVTLRRLLSHSAGVTVGGFRGYALGEEVPNLQQILDGQWPANSAPIRVDVVPGAEYRYSGGGYMIVQQLLEDVAGEPFSEIMRDSVLEPWGMTASTVESPLPGALASLPAPSPPPVTARMAQPFREGGIPTPRWEQVRACGRPHLIWPSLRQE